MKTLRFISIALAGALLVLSACKKDSGNEPSPTPGPTPIDKVTDACGNTYPVVKIGKQYWMAENLRCDKYATQSEAYNASWLTNNTIPTSEDDTFTPYYTDASDKSKWDKWYDYSDNLTDAQVKKLGYLYNWAAAVGVEDGYDYGSKPFSGNRQGICPNGWHIPSRAEWQTLYDYIYSAQKLTSKAVGKYLKTTSGWYNGDSEYKPGLDTYGFAALPAGDAGGSSVSRVGCDTNFWTATPKDDSDYGYHAYYRGLDYDYDYLYDGDHCKYYGWSVRCLKD